MKQEKFRERNDYVIPSKTEKMFVSISATCIKLSCIFVLGLIISLITGLISSIAADREAEKNRKKNLVESGRDSSKVSDSPTNRNK